MSTEDYNRIEGAKRVLRDNGYVVIPKDRRVVCTVSEAGDPALKDLMQKDAYESYQEHCAYVAARRIGMAAFDEGCVVKDERVGDGPCGLVTRYRLGIIKPREPEDHR